MLLSARLSGPPETATVNDFFFKLSNFFLKLLKIKEIYSKFLKPFLRFAFEFFFAHTELFVTQTC